MMRMKVDSKKLICPDLGKKHLGAYGAYMGITRSPLPQKYCNLSLPSNWGGFYDNFARFYYQKLG